MSAIVEFSFFLYIVIMQISYDWSIKITLLNKFLPRMNNK